MAQEKIVQTAGRDQLGGFAPKFAELNDDVLFGEVWSRTDKLGLRDRSLVTITSLISQGITDNSLTYHLQSAKNNGITRTEIAEIITHIGFLRGLAEGMGGIPSGERGMGGRDDRRGCKSCIPTQNDFSPSANPTRRMPNISPATVTSHRFRVSR